MGTLEKGPPANRAFDADGKPTKAAEGFARGKGLRVEDLTVRAIDGGEYVVATVREIGRPTQEVLAEALPDLIASIKFGKAMRWNETGIAFSRPLMRISPRCERSWRMREKCSRVMFRREASTPLLVASRTSIGAPPGASSGTLRSR